jgi:cobalt-zinc-cadmium efflux system membrane fusion protein
MYDDKSHRACNNEPINARAIRRPSFIMPRISTWSFSISLGLFCLGLGWALGVTFRESSLGFKREPASVVRTWGVGKVSPGDQPGQVQPTRGHRDGHHVGTDHIDISRAAARTLGLKVMPVGLQDYEKHIHIPAVVIEKPGQSGLAVTSPAQGIIRQIYRFPGQALGPGNRLFTLQLTDEGLESAQLAIVETITRMNVAQQELERMGPLIESGAVVGRRKLELEYELKQLLSEKSARTQELRLRGLPQDLIDRLIATRQLVGEIDVYLNIVTADPQPDDGGPGDSAQEQQALYTVEQLDVFPGRAVRKGEELCHIANHHELFLRGEAFEADVPSIHRLENLGWQVRAEFGEGGQQKQFEVLSVTYVDNHVDPQTQTFPFYLALPNRIIAENRDAAGRLFRSWQYKPGQRAHLMVPIERWKDQMVLPRQAVVRSGVESFVFRLGHVSIGIRSLVRQGIDPEQLQVRLSQLPGLEFEPVPVSVVHQDRHHLVIDANGLLRPGDLIAMNQAYQLFLAWKMQVASGGGHSHDHDH